MNPNRDDLDRSAATDIEAGGQGYGSIQAAAANDKSGAEAARQREAQRGRSYDCANEAAVDVTWKYKKTLVLAAAALVLAFITLLLTKATFYKLQLQHQHSVARPKPQIGSGRSVLEKPAFRMLIFSGRENRQKRDATRRYWLNEFNAKPADGKKLAYFVVGKNGCELLPEDRVPYTCERKTTDPILTTAAARATSSSTSSLSLSPDHIDRDHRDGRLHALLSRERQLSADLLEEQREFGGDLVLLDMVDVYKRLPLKLKLGLQWFFDEFRQATGELQWLVKVDDDTYVRPWLLQRYLTSSRRQEEEDHDLSCAGCSLMNMEEAWRKDHDARQEGLILGSILRGGHVITGPPGGKVDDPHYAKISDEYPPYPSGATATALSWHCVTSVARNAGLNDRETDMQDAALGIWVDGGQLAATLFEADPAKFVLLADGRGIEERKEWQEYDNYPLFREAAVIGHNLNSTHQCVLHYLDHHPQEEHPDPSGVEHENHQRMRKAEEKCGALHPLPATTCLGC